MNYSDTSTKSLEKKTLLTFTVGIVLLFGTIFSVLGYFYDQSMRDITTKFEKQIHLSLDHAFYHNKQECSHILKMVIQENDIKKLIKKRDFRKIEEHFLHVLKRENLDVHFEELNLYMPDGKTIALRTSQRVSKCEESKFIKNVMQKSEPQTCWIETCVQKTYYLSAIPIVDDDGTFLATAQIVFNAEHILHQIKEITGYDSAIMIKDASPEKSRADSQERIGDYTIASGASREFLELFSALEQEKPPKLNDNIHFFHDSKTYYMHTFDLLDLEGKTTAKIVAFQDVSGFFAQKRGAVYLIGLSGLALLCFVFYLFYRQLNYFKKGIQAIHDEYVKKIKFEESYLKTAFDTEPNIIVTTFGERIDRGNRALLDFAGFKTTADFKKSYRCVCDMFEDLPGYLKRDMDGVRWLDYIYQNPQCEHKAVMMKDGKKHIFKISAARLEFDKENRSIVVLDDITEIEEAKEKYQSIVENINECVWEVDEKFRYTYVSPRVKEMLGYEPDDFMGTDFCFFENEEAPEIKEAVFELVNSKAPIESLKNICLHKDGSKIILETNAQPVLDHKGELKGYRGTCRDISRQVHLENELKQKEELMIAQSRQAAMGDMIAMIAHQWRQPITVVAMAVNNIKLAIELGNEVSNEKLLKMVDTVSRQTQHLSKTIDDFRNFFKPHKEKESVYICDVMESTLEIIRKSLENNNIELSIEINCKKKIHTYPNELLQVFLNIISNAKDSLIEKKISDALIEIIIDESDDMIIASVCDNGTGIPADVIKKIGEPYVTTKRETGTGLGLYMSKTIVEKHLHGSLTWKNREKGACFTVALPIGLEG